MIIEARKYGFKRILIKHNHLFPAWDEEILTGCKTNRSSFRGFVRLVPKIINPELMPAEWRALSKLEGKHVYRDKMCLTSILDAIMSRGKPAMLRQILTYFEMKRAMVKSSATRMKKTPRNIWKVVRITHQKSPWIYATYKQGHISSVYNEQCVVVGKPKGFTLGEGVFLFCMLQPKQLCCHAFSQGETIWPGLACYSLALIFEVTGGKKWQCPDRSPRLHPGMEKVPKMQ